MQRYMYAAGFERPASSGGTWAAGRRPGQCQRLVDDLAPEARHFVFTVEPESTRVPGRCPTYRPFPVTYSQSARVPGRCPTYRPFPVTYSQ
eukprot:279305-Prymnesium_polylepis.1